MHIPTLASISEILEIPQLPSSRFGRQLQFVLPDYTSPPLPEAIEATPEEYRSNETIDAARTLDAAGLCVGETYADFAQACQMKFVPQYTQNSTVDVLFFGGALVDPPGYSPLMQMISTAYNMSVSVPIFDGDMSYKFGTCESGRLAQAQHAFPSVEKWIFVGHSLGGIAAFNDVWAMVERNETDSIGGLVLLASYLRQDLGCGMTDFSGSEWDWLPFASISASEDGIVNATNFEAGLNLLPSNSPKFINEVIEGGNHGGFGSYNYSERYTLLNQIDGNATITSKEQQRQTAAIIGDIKEMAESLIELEGSTGMNATNQQSGNSSEISLNDVDSSQSPSRNDETNSAFVSARLNRCALLLAIATAVSHSPY